MTGVADRVAARANEVSPRRIFRSARVRFWSQGSHWRPVLVIVWVVLLPGRRSSRCHSRAPSTSETLGQLPADCRLISDPGTSGAAVLLRPDVPVWYDGRADYWGRERNALAARTLSADTVDAAPFTDATCVVLRVDDPGRERLEAALDASSDWHQLARSGRVVGWIRSP